MGGEQKTQNYDVSSLIGDGVSVTSVSSSPLVSAMMISIVLNLVNFSILYYQVNWTNSENKTQYFRLRLDMLKERELIEQLEDED